MKTKKKNIIERKLESTRRRAGIVTELGQYLWTNKLWWLAPPVVILVLLAILLVIAESSAVAPFIYTLF
ncbi:MAG: hypothetical protein A2784_03545 [Candidatus Chisholmbacteria bacterium RIFCSPHIGHO2_01_FULL_48_12]|uniref:Uncharacterized protein n=1 Tax=Candidatus Chisholmbacteria bacterium RIFCSPHIGHO2_01_FULL_48_12 TaxID=1797589 RepID=A0A1G1VU99_9BACT|nr:MAG: hypothetical protein A2784_03545 [Candidatus Chisholmbacteria bacterium RIFCSPHIGHO2_01_FULL_48_12]